MGIQPGLDKAYSAREPPAGRVPRSRPDLKVGQELLQNQAQSVGSGFSCAYSVLHRTTRILEHCWKWGFCIGGESPGKSVPEIGIQIGKLVHVVPCESKAAIVISNRRLIATFPLGCH